MKLQLFNLEKNLRMPNGDTTNCVAGYAGNLNSNKSKYFAIYPGPEDDEDEGDTVLVRADLITSVMPLTDISEIPAFAYSVFKLKSVK
jgi:hypothetical protein